MITSVSSMAGAYEVGSSGLTMGSLAYTGQSAGNSSTNTWTNIPSILEGTSYVLTNSGNATTSPLSVTTNIMGTGTFYVFHSDRSVDPQQMMMGNVMGRPSWLTDNYTDTGQNIDLTNGIPNGGLETFSVFSREITAGTSSVETNNNDPATGGSFSMYGIAFSGSPVPEPSSALLGGIALLTLARRKR